MRGGPALVFGKHLGSTHGQIAFVTSRHTLRAFQQKINFNLSVNADGSNDFLSSEFKPRPDLCLGCGCRLQRGGRKSRWRPSTQALLP